MKKFYKRMRSNKFCIVLFAIIIGNAYTVLGQDKYGDSLQKTILQSVQIQLNQNFSKAFSDSSKFPLSSQADIQSLFENINKEISVAKSAGDIGSLNKAYHNLSTIDSMKGNYKSAYENYKLYTLYRDSLQKKEQEKKELEIRMQREFDKKQAQQQLVKEKEARKNTIQLIFLFAFLLVFITVSVTSFIAYKREQKSKKIVNTQKTALETSLSELQSTQQQLIHSEKMASLGELTAGIAHEIQNPLNFVNNFSEVNNELIEELKSQKSKLKNDEQDQILNDIFQNNEKINHHGKRADAIVKGMLQHSRSSSGQKEPTDINALCDEYLRLSYHGLRAKDKSFNATIKTDFDPSIGKINIIPQDIGRVILNLLTNAFYAVNEKKKISDIGYQPSVTVSTACSPLLRRRAGGEVCIKVTDNGNGIPKDILNKIFQPFFTNKPTGQGTGLGLSLSYDIITKGHGGELKVETMEGEGTTFIIQLPLI